MPSPTARCARWNKSASSSSDKAFSTNTWARLSNALFTSNDGFSVVAPINVSKPLSTNGKKASCCDLLKRWTSSTNIMVRRPHCCRVYSACSTAARISFTPANTADNGINSASEAFAINRASVVLPTPGGPQSIIDGNLPEVKASRKGLPSASKWDCPTTSSKLLGLSCSASGAYGCLSSKKPFIKVAFQLSAHQTSAELIQIGDDAT